MNNPVPIFFALVTMLLASCSTLDVSSSQQNLSSSEKWSVLPIVNHTQTPQAGLQAESIAAAMLRTRGIRNISQYPSDLNDETVFEPAERKLVDKALGWAKDQQVRYVLTGAVDEWRYKVGVDGDPVVGLVMQVIDMETQKVVWSAVGSKSGWSREALSSVAQNLLKDMFKTLRLK